MIVEIGNITSFYCSNTLAKNAGLTWCWSDSDDFESEVTLLSKRATPICVTTLVRQPTVSGGMSLNIRPTMPRNILKSPSISTKEHSHLHLVNLYDLFLNSWSKANYIPTNYWHRTIIRFLGKCHRASIKATLFPEKHIKIFFKKVVLSIVC